MTKGSKHLLTLARLQFSYKGHRYELEHDFGDDYDSFYAERMFTEGNYSCDCNRSRLLREKYPDFPELECGDQIVLQHIAIVFVRPEERHDSRACS